MSGIAGGCEVTFSDKPNKMIPRDWLVPYEKHYEVKVSSLRSMDVHHMPQQTTQGEIDSELDVASALGVPAKNVECVVIDGYEGVKFRTALKHGLAIVINRKHVISWVATGYSAEKFIDSFNASEATQKSWKTKMVTQNTNCLIPVTLA